MTWVYIPQVSNISYTRHTDVSFVRGYGSRIVRQLTKHNLMYYLLRLSKI